MVGPSPSTTTGSAVAAVIRLDGTQFGTDAVEGLGAFSTSWWSSNSIRSNRPMLMERTTAPGKPGLARGGHVAQRARMRPNRLGVSTCRLIGVEGLDLHVLGLDAIAGSPVLDVKPFIREFEPAAAEVRQPAWSTELIRGYFLRPAPCGGPARRTRPRRA